MSIITIKKDIVEGTLKPFYIFYGTSIFLMREYIKKIISMKGTAGYFESVGDIKTDLKNPALFGGNSVYVCFNDIDFLKSEKEFIYPKDKTIILYYDLKDLTARTLKLYPENVVLFEPPAKEVIAGYIEKINTNFSYALELVDCFDTEVEAFRVIENLNSYAKATKGHINDTYLMFKENGLVPGQAKRDALSIVSMILKKDLTAFIEHNKMRDTLEYSPLGILALLYNSLKRMLQIKGYTGGTPEKALGLSSPQIYYANKDIKEGNWRLGELLDMITLVKGIEDKIKIGKINKDIAIDLVLVNLFKE